MSRRKKCDPEKMKEAFEAIMKEEISSYKSCRVINLPQTTLRRYVKDLQKSSSEAMKQNWVGSKFFLVQ